MDSSGEEPALSRSKDDEEEEEEETVRQVLGDLVTSKAASEYIHVLKAHNPVQIGELNFDGECWLNSVW